MDKTTTTVKGVPLSIPDGWSQLGSNERSSTISWFITGFTHSSGKEVLIWKGVEDEKDTHIVSHTGQEVSEDDKYVVEVKPSQQDARLDDEELCKTIEEAVQQVEKHMKRITNETR